MTLKILHFFSPVGYTILNYKTSNKHRKYAMFGKQFVTKFTDSGITNSPLSTLAKLSDWNFSYNLNTKRINGGYNGTTQVPVIFVIEALAKRI